MDAESQQRIAANEALFREHNETVSGPLEQFDGGLDSPHGFMCECASRECEKMIDLRLSEYEHVRSDPAWFVVHPGHVMPEVEQPIERHDGFWIIEKLGIGRDLAQSLETR